VPELPEVETTKRGIEPHIIGRSVKSVIVRNGKLRWPVPENLNLILVKQKVLEVSRRAKYLLIKFQHGTLILHLGMSGSLRIVGAKEPALFHDHIDIVFSGGKCLRFRDPRRFGCCLWTEQNILQHKLIKKLGPEPLTDDFEANYLHQTCSNRSRSIKQHIMDNHVVVGVGNIYANEALFNAGINPKRAAGKVSLKRLTKLTATIKSVLDAAIKQGGTTLQDFANVDGNPGYFAQQLNVYGLKGQPCNVCKSTIKHITQGQRSSFYCANCQR
jgi:formamidopyrimidine-DNA glycosylase